MKTNDHWPETFGFKVGGKAPVVIISVQDNSVAQRAGLQPGDQILELNGENVQGLTKDQIILLARRSTRVPPALAVISRIRTFDLRRRRGRFGFTVRGKGPVFVHNVEPKSPAFNVGIRQGDLVLKVNGVSVRHANADQVQQVVEACGPTVSVVLIAGVLSIGEMEKRGKSGSSSSKYQRARSFYVQMNYYLQGEDGKKDVLVKALNRYARDRSIEQLCKSLVAILKTPIERKLLREIRYLIPKKHKPQYDIMVGMNAEMLKQRRPISAVPYDSISRSSTMDDFDYLMLGNGGPYRTWSSGSSMQSEYSDLINQKRVLNADSPRTVRVKRAGPGAGFGFTLTGNAPVCVRSVDKGSPAAQARLKPGDHILEINGLNVRNKTHGHVIELLKGSGSYPSLVVQWRPMSALKHQSSGSSISSKSGFSVTFDGHESDPIHRSGSSASRASTVRTDQLISRLPGNDTQHVRSLAREFKFHMNRLFTSGEQLYIKQCLIEYRRDRNIQKLLESIEPVLDDPDKSQILHYMSSLLPETEQAAFDQSAARLFAKRSDNGVVPSLNTTDGDVMDVLYRVQGMRLSDVPRERTVIGGTAVPGDPDDEWPLAGAASVGWGASSDDLDVIPVRDETRNGAMFSGDDEEEDELDLGLEELADALLEEDRKKAASQASQMLIQAEVHSPSARRRQGDGIEEAPIASSTAADESRTTPERGFVGGAGSRAGSMEDTSGPSREDLQHDLDTKSRELTHYKKIVTEQQEQLAKSKPREDEDPGSEPSKQSFNDDLAAAVQARNKEQENQDAQNSGSSASPPPPPSPGGGPIPPPPPPPPGLAAPPPPPMGALGVDGAQMTLKRVNWEKLSGVGLENTVWAQLGQNERLDSVIEFMELEQQFSTIQKTAEKEPTKKKKPAVLDPKKAYNISILLGHLKMSFDEIKAAIMAMDDSKLEEAHLRQLILYAPDSTELQMYKYFADETAKLELADRFSYVMSKVPYYNQRLKAMLFRAQFDDKADEVKPDLEAVIEASKELKTSEKLQKLLELVLLTGNYMNKGNVRIAGAQAFRISYLTKLNSTKTTDNKSTLLNFLVQKIETKCPELLDIKKDLKTVPVAAKVSGQMVATEVQDLCRRMKALKDDLISFQARTFQEADDRFTEVVINIIEETEGVLEELLDLQKQMNEQFKEVVKFFGEKESKMNTEDFFGIFAGFLVHFNMAVNQNVTKRKLKEEQAKREERSKLFKELRQRSMSVEEEGEQAKDELLKSLDSRRPKILPRLSETDDVFTRSSAPENKESPTKNRTEGRWRWDVERANSSTMQSLPAATSPPENNTNNSSPQKHPSPPPKPPKPPKPEKPVKPAIQRVYPPKPNAYVPKSNRRGSDSNNNVEDTTKKNNISSLEKTNQFVIIKAEDLKRERVLEHVKMERNGNSENEPKVEGSGGVDRTPRSFKNIMTAFETNSRNEKPLEVEVEDVYAKPDMSKKTPKQTTPVKEEKAEEAPPPPPRLYQDDEKVGEVTPALEPPQSYQDEQDYAYADPGPPNFKPPPPPVGQGSNKRIKSSPVSSSQGTSRSESPHLLHEDLGPPSFKPPPPPERSLPLPPPMVSVGKGRFTPPPEFRSSTPPVRSDKVKSTDYDEVVTVKAEKQESKAVDPYAEVKAVSPYSAVNIIHTMPPTVDNDYEEVIVRGKLPPVKPTPYKPTNVSANEVLSPKQGSRTPRHFGVLPLIPYAFEGNLSISVSEDHMSFAKREHLDIGSPELATVSPGSPRLSSAQIVTNENRTSQTNQLSKELTTADKSPETNKKTGYRPPTPPTRDRLTDTPEASPSSPRKSKPPPPPRTTSIKDLAEESSIEPEIDIDKIIAKALSSNLKPRNELDEIPVRDTNSKVKENGGFMSSSKPYLPPKPALPPNKPQISNSKKPSPPAKVSQSALLPRAFGAPRNRSGSTESTGFVPAGAWSYTGNNQPQGRSTSRDTLGIEIAPPPPTDVGVPSLDPVIPPPSWQDSSMSSEEPIKGGHRADLLPLNLPKPMATSQMSPDSESTPPLPPSQPPPSLPLDSAIGFDIPSPSNEYKGFPGGLVNGFGSSTTASISDEEDFTPPPPMPPSDKYGFQGNAAVPPPPAEFGTEERLKPLVPPLRKHR